jgi:hypothetical protein
MIKKLLVAGTVSLGLLAPVVATTQAQAAYRVGCASHSEFNRLRLDYTQARVHNVLGTTGYRRAYDRSGANNRRLDVWRRYRPCGYPRDRIEVRLNDYSRSGTVDRGGALRVYKGTWKHYCLNSKPLYRNGKKIGYYCYDAGWRGRVINGRSNLSTSPTGAPESSNDQSTPVIVDRIG